MDIEDQSAEPRAAQRSGGRRATLLPELPAARAI